MNTPFPRFVLLSAVVFAVCLSTACTGEQPAQTKLDPATVDQSAPDAQLTGTVRFRERMLLKPGSVVEVWLLDTSRADVAATEMAYQKIANPGQPPISFRLSYNPAEIRENMQYVVRAQISHGDTLIYTSDTHNPVLTRGAGNDVDLLLERVAPAGRAVGAPTKPDASLTNTYWKLASINGTPIKYQGQQREPHLKLRGDELAASGRTGCNAFSGSYETYADSLRLGTLAVTQMACIEGLETEASFLAALKTVDRFAITGDRMILYSGDKAVLGFDAIYF